jgi:signal transduction histidine kinase
VLYGYAEAPLRLEHPLRATLRQVLVMGIHLTFCTGDLFNLFVAFEVMRIGLEAVANAVRHAYEARIEMRICYRDREVVVEVKDDGRGFDANEVVSIVSGHFGLLGLRERVNKLQGQLRSNQEACKLHSCAIDLAV